jgi:hypothetical protein
VNAISADFPAAFVQDANLRRYVGVTGTPEVGTNLAPPRPGRARDGERRHERLFSQAPFSQRGGYRCLPAGVLSLSKDEGGSVPILSKQILHCKFVLRLIGAGERHRHNKNCNAPIAFVLQMFHCWERF